VVPSVRMFGVPPLSQTKVVVTPPTVFDVRKPLPS
jgi:hypothetical protein